MRTLLTLWFCFLVGCGDAGRTAAERDAATATPAAESDGIFVADLRPVNARLASPSGTARIEVAGDQLIAEVNATGTPPNMMHLQHIHGFPDGRAGSCAGLADANNDGVIDLMELQNTAGETMIPLHQQPASMEIKTETYPTAGADGSYSYRQTAPLPQLRQSFQQKYPAAELNPATRTVVVHGVPSGNLPKTAQSLGNIPAHVTLPILCGELRPVAATPR